MRTYIIRFAFLLPFRVYFSSKYESCCDFYELNKSKIKAVNSMRKKFLKIMGSRTNKNKTEFKYFR
jgi:hypothetical protein